MYDSIYYDAGVTTGLGLGLGFMVVLFAVYFYAIVASMLSTISLARLSGYTDKASMVKLFFSSFAMSEMAGIGNGLPIAIYVLTAVSVVTAFTFIIPILCFIAILVLNIVLVVKLGKNYNIGTGRIVAGVLFGYYIIIIKIIADIKAERAVKKVPVVESEDLSDEE